MAYRISNMTRCEQRAIDFPRHYSSELPPFWSQIGLATLDEMFEPRDATRLAVTAPTDCHWATGYEDPRIFEHENELFALVTHRNDRWVFELSLLELDTDYNVSRIIPIEPDVGAGFHQKNWNPFSIDSRLYCVGSIAPHRVYEIDLKSGSATLAFETATAAFDNLTETHDMRGGAGHVRVGNSFIGIARAVLRQHPDENTNNYQCVAYSFASAPPFAITGRSRPFRIASISESSLIEMVTGIVAHGENVIIGYGENDCDCRLAVIDRDKLIELIEPV